jgi:heterodisulfide reductase subunit B
MKGIKNANPLNIDSIDIQKFINECDENEGLTYKNKVRDYIIKKVYFTYDDMDNVKKCVIELKDVLVISNIGREELDSWNMVDYLDGEGFKLAF